MNVWVCPLQPVNEFCSLASNLFVFWLTLLINYKHYKYKSYQKANLASNHYNGQAITTDSELV